MSTSLELQAVADLLRERQSFLLIPHERADGDALGSVLALARALQLHGKTAFPLALTEVSERYRFLLEQATLPVLGRDISIDRLPAADAVLILDTGARQQLQSVLTFLDGPRPTLAVIDHHAYRDLACDRTFADDTTPATGILVAELLTALGWLDDAQTAAYLLLAIGADTGWFAYSNTTADCFAWAHKLVRLGADSRALYEKLFLSDSVPRFRLLARALASTELRAKDRVVALTLRKSDFVACGADEAHTENLIDQACRLKSMLVAALFVEQSETQTRVSLRSRDPFDVHRFAARFGGGGHRRAAGIKMAGPIDQVRSLILAALEQEASAASGSIAPCNS